MNHVNFMKVMSLMQDTTTTINQGSNAMLKNNVTTKANHTDHMLVMDRKALGHMGGHGMYFTVAYPIRVLFFEWLITNQSELIGSCIGVCLFAILYEGLKVLRQYLLLTTNKRISYKGKQSQDASFSSIATKPSLYRLLDGWHLLQSLLQILQTTLSMFLMLIYMTYNPWLAISVSVGSGIGYYIFSWPNYAMLSFGDHCQ